MVESGARRWAARGRAPEDVQETTHGLSVHRAGGEGYARFPRPDQGVVEGVPRGRCERKGSRRTRWTPRQRLAETHAAPHWRGELSHGLSRCARSRKDIRDRVQYSQSSVGRSELQLYHMGLRQDTRPPKSILPLHRI
ncbi:hypothetical protein AAFF_G00161110 [Aldrovandia affinis]|uniref:Uncharacterized protein n=1 Tax=Aldrovandia affinis TaxID=143900 RepID=A0AAD7W7U4_9TELE|nr:hypothetical protein AAFF_G00161110 [Aldrovandia affinis]